VHRGAGVVDPEEPRQSELVPLGPWLPARDQMGGLQIFRSSRA
jgi:hypothetical protein